MDKIKSLIKYASLRELVFENVSEQVFAEIPDAVLEELDTCAADTAVYLINYKTVVIADAVNGDVLETNTIRGIIDAAIKCSNQ